MCIYVNSFHFSFTIHLFSLSLSPSLFLLREDCSLSRSSAYLHKLLYIISSGLKNHHNSTQSVYALFVLSFLTFVFRLCSLCSPRIASKKWFNKWAKSVKLCVFSCSSNDSCLSKRTKAVCVEGNRLSILNGMLFETIYEIWRKLYRIWLLETRDVECAILGFSNFKFLFTRLNVIEPFLYRKYRILSRLVDLKNRNTFITLYLHSHFGIDMKI